MLGLKLLHLIENQSEELAQGLAQKIRTSERTSDFRKIPAEKLQLAAADVYRNLGEWLLHKTENDIEQRFKAIAARRAAEGIALHQFAWALMISRDYLWHFLQGEAFADNIVELFGKLELQQMLNQFFDRAVYYGILGYDEALVQETFTAGARTRKTGASHGVTL
jgi:transcriptional regulator with XRE-family HTH domain